MNNLRKLINLVERGAGNDNRLDRSAFVYMEPTDNPDQHAQCTSCFMFMPKKQRCSIFPKDFKVVATASCNLYVSGAPNDNQPFRSSVSPDAAGYVEAEVRCENCSWFNKPNNCGLFTDLNKQPPQIWNLNETVNPKGCCNAWQA